MMSNSRRFCSAVALASVVLLSTGAPVALGQGIGGGGSGGGGGIGSTGPAGVALKPPKINWGNSEISPGFLVYLAVGAVIVLGVGVHFLPTKRGHQD